MGRWAKPNASYMILAGFEPNPNGETESWPAFGIEQDRTDGPFHSSVNIRGILPTASKSASFCDPNPGFSNSLICYTPLQFLCNLPVPHMSVTFDGFTSNAVKTAHHLTL